MVRASGRGRQHGWIRRLDSGLWAATIRTPVGRLTETHELKSVVATWADDQARAIAAGDWIDPREGETTVGQLWDRFRNARHLELASRKRDESHWRCHVEPRWAGTQIAAILKPDVSAWVVDMRERKIGATTIQGSLGVLRALLEQAVDARMLRFNPCAGVNAPRRGSHLDRVLAPEEDELLLAELDRLFPDRPDARLFCEVLLYCGPRWEEAAAIDREHVDRRRRMINLGPVVERDGTIRPYPKSPAGQRSVPVDDDLWPRLLARVLQVPVGGLLFVAPRGGVLNYSDWHRRVWSRVVRGGVSARPVAWSPERFGAWLDEHKAAAGYVTDKDVALAAGLNPSLMSNWRYGRFRPRPATVDKLAAALGAPPSGLRLVAGIGERGGAGLADPQPTPHDLRHTYGTRLGEQGVPQHEIMALMGHETAESSQRYLHAGEDRFERARKAMRAARKSVQSP